MAMVRMYHPKNDPNTCEVPEQSVPVLEKRGWTTEVPESLSDSYVSKKVPELRDLAAERGIEVASDAKKDEIIQALIAADTPKEA